MILGGTRHVYAGSGPPAQAGALPMAMCQRAWLPLTPRTCGRRRCLDRIVCVHHRPDHHGIRMTANGVPAFTPVLPGHHPQIFTYSRIRVVIPVGQGTIVVRRVRGSRRGAGNWLPSSRGCLLDSAPVFTRERHSRAPRSWARAESAAAGARERLARLP